MFGKKNKDNKQIKNEDEFGDMSMTVIPDVFHGGADPEVYHQKNVAPVEQRKPMSLKAEYEKPKELDTSVLPKAPQMVRPPVQKPVLTSMPKPGVASPVNKTITQPTKVRTKSGGNKLFIVIIILLACLIGGGVWYYINSTAKARQKQLAAQQAVITPPVFVPPVIPTPIVVPPVVPTIIETPPVPTKTPSLLPQPLTFPPIILTDTVDLDQDLLTDLEEEVFGTDSGEWDTDGDGYYDGQEVFNLYNPKGFAPIRLIDSGLVREYVNPSWKYRVYYPQSWEVGAVDVKSDQVIFSSITGDFVEIHAFEKDGGVSFADWFALEAGGEQFTELQNFENRFMQPGLKRRDSLVAYFPTENAVYVLVYHPSESVGATPFRHIMQMMYQSMRPGTGIVPELPPQTPLPSAPDFSVTLPGSNLPTTTQDLSESDTSS